MLRSLKGFANGGIPDLMVEAPDFQFTLSLEGSGEPRNVTSLFTGLPLRPCRETGCSPPP